MRDQCDPARCVSLSLFFALSTVSGAESLNSFCCCVRSTIISETFFARAGSTARLLISLGRLAG